MRDENKNRGRYGEEGKLRLGFYALKRVTQMALKNWPVFKGNDDKNIIQWSSCNDSGKIQKIR